MEDKKMNEILTKENIKIEDMIFEVRGKQVILSSNVAKLYKTETRIINQTIKRNIMRFPETFCFQLTAEEIKNLTSQFVISSIANETSHGGVRYLPYVLTEQGIMMLSGLLKSDIAAKVNVQIIDAFVVMKKYISETLVNQNFINNLVYKHDEEIKLLKTSFDKLQEKEKKNAIFFEGQIYDAYSLLLDILHLAIKEIIIIDNYAGKEILDILKEIDKNIIIYSANMNETLIKKYEAQYKNVKLIYNNKFHDRFIVIDREKIYHCGSSLKDAGKKCFAINKIESKEILNNILKELEK